MRTSAETLPGARVYKELRVISKEMLTEDICSLWLDAPFADTARAGQFVSFYLSDPSRLLPRPISICERNPRLGALRFVFRIAGEGTRILSQLRSGQSVLTLGPNGNGYPLEEANGKRVLLIGGGLGIPPLLGLAKDLQTEPCGTDGMKRPRAVTVAAGYRSEPYLLEDLKENAAVFYATEDGSSGIAGNVLDAVRANPYPADLIMSCGPKPMLRAVASYAKENGIPCYVSMEERMACGIGACLACTCETVTEDEHYHVKKRRVCEDGPVFSADEVVL